MPTWPASLPQSPGIDGYAEQVPNVMIASQMDAGPEKRRKRFTAGVRPFHFRILLKRADVATFDTFYVTTLAGGTLTFDWTHPRTGAVATFAFQGQPKYTPRGYDAWYVDFDAEIRP